MSSTGSMPPGRVPTLTEVVAWPASAAAAPVVPPPKEAQRIEAGAAPLHPPRMAEDQMIQQVLAEVQRQVDLMLEYRMREVLTPLFTRATDSLIRDARGELASALRDLVARAVAQELSRHRSP